MKAGAVELRLEESRGPFKISLARRSSATFPFSTLISAISSLVLPGRTPTSMSACQIHLRDDSVEVMPSFAAIDRIVTASFGYSARGSITIRAALSRSSGVHFEERAVRVILPETSSTDSPGRLKLSPNHRFKAEPHKAAPTPGRRVSLNRRGSGSFAQASMSGSFIWPARHRQVESHGHPANTTSGVRLHG